MHIHGQHEHALEHHAQSGDSLAQRIAMLTALLSTLGAVFAYAGAHSQNQAMLLKNEAIIKKTEASDQWNFYQAKSQKQALMLMAQSLSTDPEKIAHFEAEAKRYEQEKSELQTKAKGLDEESAALNEKSAEEMQPHTRLAQAMTFLQISIALASIAALTRRRWLVACAIGSAAIGVILGVPGFF
jgi:hypothetical protein